MFKLGNKYLLISSLMAIPSISLVTSCGANTSSNNSKNPTTTKFQESLNANDNWLSSKNITNDDILNFVTLTTWNSIDQLVSIEFLGKYCNVSDGFINFLNENNDIYKSINKIVIEPIVNTQNLTIIFYLNSYNNDLNIVTRTIQNALSTNFAYKNEISVSKKNPQTTFESKEKFNDSWNKVKNKETVDTNELKTILNNAFTSTTSDWQNKIIEGYKQGLISINNSNFKIELVLNNDGINKGYIFNLPDNTNTLNYNTFIISNPLVK